MQGIVDRFAGEFVVIEIDGKTRDIPKPFVADDVQEGDVVDERGGLWVKNKEATDARSKEIKKLMDDLWED